MESVPHPTSTGVLELDHLPESMMVIGGVIGCELGTMFSRMGSRYTYLIITKV